MSLANVKANFSLKLASADLDPEEINQVMGATADRSWKAGWRRNAACAPRPDGEWHKRLVTAADGPQFSDAQTAILVWINERFASFGSLRKGVKRALYVSIYSGDQRPYAIFKAELLEAIGRHGIALEIDVMTMPEFQEGPVLQDEQQ